MDRGTAVTIRNHIGSEAICWLCSREFRSSNIRQSPQLCPEHEGMRRRLVKEDSKGILKWRVPIGAGIEHKKRLLDDRTVAVGPFWSPGRNKNAK